MEKNKKINLELEITKKQLYFFILLIGVTGIITVAAQIPFGGHSASEVEVNIPQPTTTIDTLIYEPLPVGGIMSIQSAVDNGYLDPYKRSTPRLTFYSTGSGGDASQRMLIGKHDVCVLTDVFKYTDKDSGGSLSAGDIALALVPTPVGLSAVFGNDKPGFRGFCGVGTNWGTTCDFSETVDKEGNNIYPDGCEQGDWILSARRVSYCGTVCIDWFPHKLV